MKNIKIEIRIFRNNTFKLNRMPFLLIPQNLLLIFLNSKIFPSGFSKVFILFSPYDAFIIDFEMLEVLKSIVAKTNEKTMLKSRLNIKASLPPVSIFVNCAFIIV